MDELPISWSERERESTRICKRCKCAALSAVEFHDKARMSCFTSNPLDGTRAFFKSPRSVDIDTQPNEIWASVQLFLLNLL